MRTHKYLSRKDAGASSFSYIYPLAISTSLSNIVTAYVHSNRLPVRLNRLALDMAEKKTSSTVDATPCAWQEWCSIIREKAVNNSLNADLSAHLDEIGRGAFLTSKRANGGSPTLFDRFSTVLEAAVAVHQPVPNWGAHCSVALKTRAGVTSSVIYKPLLVTHKEYLSMPGLTPGVKGDLFRAPPLSLAWSKSVRDTITVIDGVRWNNDVFSIFCNSKAIEGVQMQSRASFDILMKRMQIKSGVIMWLLYELQPLVMFAQFMLPVYRAVQAEHERLYQDGDRLVKRGRSIIEAAELVASFPLHEMLTPIASINRSAINVDSLFGNVGAMFLPATDADGFISPLHLTMESFTNVNRNKTLPEVQYDDKADLVSIWRRMCAEAWDSSGASAPLWQSQKDVVTPWLDWRTVAAALSSLVGWAEAKQLATHLGWGSGVSTLGSINIDNRGADFSFTDTDGYQKNIWQCALGMTPTIGVNYDQTFKYSIELERDFGIGNRDITWGVLAFKGHFGDHGDRAYVERFVIPRCAWCYEEKSTLALGLESREPHVLAYYAAMFPSGIPGAGYVATATKAGVTTYRPDAWDGTFVAACGAAAALTGDIAAQFAEDIRQSTSMEFVRSEVGFNMRSPIRMARGRVLYVFDRNLQALASIPDEGTVIWDEQDETAVDCSSSHVTEISAFLDFHLGAIKMETKGGHGIAMTTASESDI